MSTPRKAHHDKLDNISDNEIITREIADNAVNYKKLDSTGRSYKIEYSYGIDADTLGSTFSRVLGLAPYSGTITSVTFTADKSVILSGTDFFTLAIEDLGTDGIVDNIIASYIFNTDIKAYVAQSFDLEHPIGTIIGGDILRLTKYPGTTNTKKVPLGKLEIIIDRSV
jgi:hypothetical protein